MSCLRHPNVVMLMASCQSPPRLVIVMEYVAGGSLYGLLHVKQSVLQTGNNGLGALFANTVMLIYNGKSSVHCSRDVKKIMLNIGI